MTDTEADGRDDPDYIKIRERFSASYDAAAIHGGNYRDDAFISDAIWVMCIEAIRQGGDTPLAKATQAIAARLMGSPELRKEWLVTFPYVWGSKDSALTPGEMKRRGIAFQVWQKVKANTLVTHAIAEVAAALHVSPQKVAKDYYDWKEHHDRIADMASGKHWLSNSGEQEKE